MVKDMEYNYTDWQARMNATNEEAADLLDCSLSHYLTLKRNSRGRPLYAWAAYGQECARKAREQAAC
jgi:hypothetical protein